MSGSASDEFDEQNPLPVNMPGSPVSRRSKSVSSRSSSRPSRHSTGTSYDPNYPEAAIIERPLSQLTGAHTPAGSGNMRGSSKDSQPTLASILREMKAQNARISTEFSKLHRAIAGVSDRQSRLERQVEEMAKGIANLRTIQAVTTTHSSQHGKQGPIYVSGI